MERAEKPKKIKKISDLEQLAMDTEKVVVCKFLLNSYYIFKVRGKLLMLVNKDVLDDKKFKELYLRVFDKVLDISKKEFIMFVNNAISPDSPLRITYTNEERYLWEQSEYRTENCVV